MSLEKKNNSGPMGSTSIPPETIELDKWYSFTFNVANTKGQMLLDYKSYYSLIQRKIRVIKGISYSFALELSKFGRLHCHGRVKFTKMHAISFWYEFLYGIGCNFSFDTIGENELDKWIEYMFKGKRYMQPILDKLKLEYELTDSNMTPPSGEKSVGPIDKYL